MAHKHQEAESAGEGSPLWMVSFSDCMTLLMSFFLVLTTFSSYGDEGEYSKAGGGVGEGRPALMEGKKEGGAVVPRAPMPDQPAQGSETMTPEALAGLVSSGGKQNPKKAETYANKVFSIPSTRLFYAKSDVLSEDGRKVLGVVGQYAKSIQARMVISEGGVPSAAGSDSHGLARSMAMLRFFVTECGLSSDKMCISVSGTIPRDQRKAEIALLERSVYK
jgi:hypothetical protein